MLFTIKMALSNAKLSILSQFSWPEGNKTPSIQEQVLNTESVWSLILKNNTKVFEDYFKSLDEDKNNSLELKELVNSWDVKAINKIFTKLWLDEINIVKEIWIEEIMLKIEEFIIEKANILKTELSEKKDIAKKQWHLNEELFSNFIKDKPQEELDVILKEIRDIEQSWSEYRDNEDKHKNEEITTIELRKSKPTKTVEKYLEEKWYKSDWVLWPWEMASLKRFLANPKLLNENVKEEIKESEQIINTAKKLKKERSSNRKKELKSLEKREKQQEKINKESFAELIKDKSQEELEGMLKKIEELEKAKSEYDYLEMEYKNENGNKKFPWKKPQWVSTYLEEQWYKFNSRLFTDWEINTLKNFLKNPKLLNEDNKTKIEQKREKIELEKAEEKINTKSFNTLIKDKSKEELDNILKDINKLEEENKEYSKLEIESLSEGEKNNKKAPKWIKTYLEEKWYVFNSKLFTDWEAKAVIKLLENNKDKLNKKNVDNKINNIKVKEVQWNVPKKETIKTRKVIDIINSFNLKDIDNRVDDIVKNFNLKNDSKNIEKVVELQLALKSLAPVNILWNYWPKKDWVDWKWWNKTKEAYNKALNLIEKQK